MKTMKTCRRLENLKENLKKIGFENASYINLLDGIVAIHKGFKIT